MNYLKCIEKIDKVRDHWLNEGETESLALMEYEDTKNTIKINMVFPLSEEKPFLHINIDLNNKLRSISHSKIMLITIRMAVITMIMMIIMMIRIIMIIKER